MGLSPNLGFSVIPRENEGFTDIQGDDFADPYYEEYDSYDEDFEPDYAQDFSELPDTTEDFEPVEAEDDFEWSFDGSHASKPPDLSGFFRSLF